MIGILMMSAKLVTPGFLKITAPWKKGYEVTTSLLIDMVGHLSKVG